MIVQWARDQFEGTFRQAPETALQYLVNEESLFDQLAKQGGMQVVRTMNTALFVLR